MEERYLITGGGGFLGAWIARRLIEDGARVAILDSTLDSPILEQVLEPAHLERIHRTCGDVVDGSVVGGAIALSGATVVIHLAGLQVPACRADPLRGARVNVLGTLSVFEAARASRGQVRSVIYASSAAVAGPPVDYPAAIPDGAHHIPRTHYGVFKLANEGSARVYWEDHRIPSVGIRPLAIYGPGREVGLTSGPTKAIKAAVLGRDYVISFSGRTGFSYVEDVAAAFAASARRSTEGARAFNLRGSVMTVEEFVAVLESVIPEAAGTIRVTGPVVPVAYDVLDSGLESFLGELPRTPVAEGIRRTPIRFRELQARGKLNVRDLES